ncbi:hypothetical protein AD10_3199 [Escherichia coli 1-182-04_S4_C2]|nr:hypothetical protein AD39_3212 [Escherichia coli 1-182-04_S4_C3]EZJ39858.1 hypothetical protein AD10_3199 [Escherichia coli 1-182-04_S4_C2]EZJ60199.1 hypothetical protein AC82_2950 [Escherichia coli 1-182-04_S4_C1]
MFPASAGINRGLVDSGNWFAGVPRVSGDKPLRAKVSILTR